jgi:hypothetical protein
MRSIDKCTHANLLGKPFKPLDIPKVFLRDLARFGLVPIDPIPTDDDHSLFDELSQARGYEFDWGYVVADFPPWHFPEDFKCAWRIVPTTLWDRLLAKDRLAVPIPVALARVRLDVLFTIYPRFDQTIQGDPGLAYDLCAPYVSAPEDADGLFHWLESRFLLRILPPALNYLEALALDLALRATAEGETKGMENGAPRSEERS